MTHKQKKRATFALTAALASTAMVSTVATAAATEYTDYVVVKGDNLYRLAIKYNTTVDLIVAENNISNRNLIHVNQKLKIPTNTNSSGSGSSNSGSSSSSSGYHTVVKGDTLSALALKYGTTVNQLASWNNISNVNFIRTGWTLKVSASAGSTGGSGSSGNTSGTVGANEYKVVAGDNLYRLAIKFNTTVEQLAAWNNISNVRLIYVGDILKVSESTQQTAGATVDTEVTIPDTTPEEVAPEVTETPEVSTPAEDTNMEVVTPEAEAPEAPVAEEVVADEVTEAPSALDEDTVVEVEIEVDEATADVLDADLGSMVDVPVSESTEASAISYEYTEVAPVVEEVAVATPVVTNYFTVKETTSVFQLAALFNASVSDLIAWNDIEDTNSIPTGTVLRISL